MHISAIGAEMGGRNITDGDLCEEENQAVVQNKEKQGRLKVGRIWHCLFLEAAGDASASLCSQESAVPSFSSPRHK